MVARWAAGEAARHRGGRRRRAGPLFAELRQEAAARVTWLLDITTDLEISTIVAVSTDAHGFGLACGLAARVDPAEAARTAVLELCQMELANRLVELKLRRGGPDILAPIDKRHLRRMEGIDANHSAVLTASGAPRPLKEGSPACPEESLNWVADRLARAGIECLAVDLTRSAIGIPVVRAVAPLLQTLAGGAQTQRLSDVLVRHRDRFDHLPDVDLM